jgi:hypothetical protein
MKHRILVVVLSVLFCVGTAIHTFHFPFRVSAVKRVIPANAVMVSRHIAPAGRVMDFLASGMLDPALHAFGEEEDGVGLQLVQDEGVRWLVETLGRRYLATGYVESFGGTPRPAFLASAWVGGLYTHLSRMGFLDHAFPDFRVVRVDKSTRIWRGYFDDLPRGFRHVSFGFYEGVLFGVAGDDPIGAAVLSRVMQRQARSGSSDLLEAHADALPADIPDRVLLQGVTGGGIWLAPVFGRGEAVVVHGYAPLPEQGAVGFGTASGLGDILPLVAPVASAVLGMSAESGLGMMKQLPLHMVMHDVAELVYTYATGRKEDAALVAWVTNWEHGGRVMRLRVPSLALALEAPSGLSAADVLSRVLLRINQRYNLHWEYTAYGDHGVYTLIPPQGFWYARLLSGERLGVAVWNGLLLIHSSASALDSMLASLAKAGSLDPYRLPDDTGLFARVDMPAAGNVLRMGLSSYGLWQAMEGQARDRDREALMRQIADGIGAYSVLEMVSMERAGGVAGSVRLERVQGEP